MTETTAERQVLVHIEDAVKHFPIRGGLFLKEVDRVQAVNGINLDIYHKETFGLVGESGCGKSTLGNLLLGLDKPTSGSIFFDNQNIHSCSRQSAKQIRRDIQAIFQDPYESLNPRMTVGELVSEGLRIQGELSRQEIDERVKEMLSCVGLSPQHAKRYPHEFSGGQRQRIVIARALIVSPRFIVCDEPVSALDVSVQAQILNLLKELQQKFGFTYLFIAHGLNVVKYLSDRIGVMYLGQLVEVATSEQLFADPKHPYTQALLKAIPDLDAQQTFEPVLKGDVPSPIRLPSGCTFHPRCGQCMEKCRTVSPTPVTLPDGTVVRCHLYDQP